jgi:hypothetical protein
MFSLGYGWWAVLGSSLVVWIFLPFLISQLCAAFVLACMRRVDIDELSVKIADAVKGLPPEEQLIVGKRIIDQSLK